MCSTAPFQPQPDSNSQCAGSVCPALPDSLHLLCNDSIHCHTQPGNLYVIVCVHFRTAVIPLRHLLARRRNARILEVFSYIFPSTFGINGYVRINSMGATLNEVAFEYQALWIQTGIYFLTTCLVYQRKSG